MAFDALFRALAAAKKTIARISQYDIPDMFSRVAGVGTLRRIGIRAMFVSIQAIRAIRNMFGRVTRTVQKHPKLFIALALGIITAPFITMALLNLAGFTASGVLGGSIAAAVHSLIGNVAAGSLFAILQSAAAGGYGFVIVTTAAPLVAGGIVVIGIIIKKWFKNKGEDNESA